MSTTSLQYSPTITEDTLNLIASSLSQQGHIILKDALPTDLIDELLTTAINYEAQFKRAGIGRENQHQLNRVVRTDQIRWIDATNPIEAAYLCEMEGLRVAMNKRLFMGLFDYEANFAHYPSGAFYKKHLDAFKGETNRILTTVFYLNEQWGDTDGGDLVIYDLADQTLLQVKPEAGTLVVFLSDEFPHEVKKTFRDRYSIAGWFRVNNSSVNRADPPL
ncbi:2OG-Fe(II) oxygenase [Neptunomonas qingdaonensis]|uniref:SM-20-related protein n=1 Tax=Neptunomonas qingdaonensis TaxID=1045558 RepID=A0A1I2U190_9GAMM|nr:2OG-Fe(II) oxygenase [Neptunomonas qingdaonensis]SFG70743.1 SM-20-related protein [Neptunomonas qingdaonensis]